MRDNFYFIRRDPELYVWEVLAYSMYDVLIEANRKNVIAFIYKCIKTDAEELQHYAEAEEHEYISLVESMSRTIENLYYCPEVHSLRDYICTPKPDDYCPIFYKPRLYNYDPNYDYINDEPYR